MRNLRLKLYSVVVTILALLALTSAAYAVSEVRTVMPDQGRATIAEFDGLQLEVPAGATDQEITISRGEDNLAGIQETVWFPGGGIAIPLRTPWDEV